MEKVTLVLGASLKPERFSHKAIISLQKHKHPVIAIGLREGLIGNIMIQKELPSDTIQVHTISLYLSPRNQKQYYNHIITLKPKRIIFNPGTTNPELAELAWGSGIETVDDCLLVMLNSGRF